MTNKDDLWQQAYRIGKEEERRRSLKDSCQRRIRNALSEAVGEYRYYIEKLKDNVMWVDEKDYIAYGKLSEAKRLFHEVRKEEEDQAKNQQGGIVRAVKPSEKADETVIREG